MQMRVIAFRLAGTRLCAAYGRELKGLGYLALWREQDSYEIARAVHRVYTDNDPVVLAHTAMSQSNRFVEYESILLPLMPAADGNARILGATSAKRQPYWIGADPLTENHLRMVRLVEAEELAPVLAPLVTGGTDVNNTPPKRKGHLVVFEGGLSDRQDG